MPKNLPKYLVLNEDGLAHNAYVTSLLGATEFFTKWAEKSLNEPFLVVKDSVVFDDSNENDLYISCMYYNETQEPVKVKFQLFLVQSAYQVDIIDVPKIFND